MTTFKVGDRVQPHSLLNEPSRYAGTLVEIHETAPNPRRPGCTHRVKLDTPYRSRALGDTFETLTFYPGDLEVIQ